MKKILVTGAGGFIGYNLCNYLVDQGHAVTGIDLHFPADTTSNQPTKFTSHISDFRNQESMKQYLAGVEIIFHLASAHLQVSLEEKEEPRIFINPDIVNISGSSTVEEGCLSIPGVREEVVRPEKITLSYQDQNGNKITKKYEGWLARVLQHEIDHLNGILFVDHISPVKRQMLIQQGQIPAQY